MIITPKGPCRYFATGRGRYPLLCERHALEILDQIAVWEGGPPSAAAEGIRSSIRRRRAGNVTAKKRQRRSDAELHEFESFAAKRHKPTERDAIRSYLRKNNPEEWHAGTDEEREALVKAMAARLGRARRRRLKKV